MKSTLLKFLALFFLISCIFVSADTNWIASQNGRNFSLYNVAGVNITGGFICFGNNSCFGASNFSSSGSYLPGLGLNLTGNTFNVNTTYLQIYNETAAILVLDGRESANNATQASLIAVLFTANATIFNKQVADNATQASQIASLVSSLSTLDTRVTADNTTQGVLIAVLRLDNTTQATLISNLNTALASNASRFNADNATQDVLISRRLVNGSDASLSTVTVSNNVSANSFFGFLNWSWIQNVPSYFMDFTAMIQNVNSTILAKTDADNTTQGVLIGNVNTALASNVSRLNADNTTQASLIATQTSLQSANNNTQASLIATLRIDNTTQASLINLKADTASPSFTGTANFVNANFTGIIYINNVNYTNSTSYVQASQFLEGGVSLYTKYANITAVLADNTTQASLITAQAGLISALDTREAANNATQANNISLIMARVNANNITLNTNISNIIARVNANNATLNTNISNIIARVNANNLSLDTKFTTDNTTQASLIATQTSLQAANNISQNAYIDTKLSLSGGTMTGNISFGASTQPVISNTLPRYIWYMNATFWDCLNATGTIYNRGNSSVTCS